MFNITSTWENWAIELLIELHVMFNGAIGPMLHLELSGCFSRYKNSQSWVSMVFFYCQEVSLKKYHLKKSIF